ncbi:MAG TPA: AEC family transporter [Ilumatobacter sp.]|nr:AEC family transporter [Ilumatobacter sp.]
MAPGSILRVFTDVMLPVLLVAAVGGLAGRRLGLQLETLQRATFYLFSPALVFDGLANVHLQRGALARLVAVSVTVFVLNAAIGVIWARIRRVPATSAAAIAIGSAVPNQGNMGLPMALLAFGPAGLELATVLFVIGVVLNSSAAVTLGTFSLGGHARRDVLLAPLRFPAIYAAAAGISANLLDLRLPAAATESVATLAQASIPVMLVILGLSFHTPRLDRLVDPLAVSVNRLVVGPLLAWAGAAVIGLSGLGSHVAIMMAGMPVAVNTTILAGQLRADAELATQAVIVSTMCSIVTLSVLISVL